MGAQAVELLANVGLGRQQHGLLVQPLRIERGTRLAQAGELLGQASGDGLRRPRRRACGALDQAPDGGELPRDDAFQPFALREPRSEESGQRQPKPREKRLGQIRSRSLVVLPFHHLDDAAHGEQRIEARGLEASDGERPLRHGQCLAQHRLVQANLRLSGLPLQAESDRDIPAGKLLLA